MDGSESITDINVFAYTHSGTTYLLNILLELDICIYRGDFNTFWKKENDNRLSINPKEKIDLGVWFPRLQTDSEFNFKPPHCIRWSHTLPTDTELQCRTILVVRDPRDVLLSFAARIAQQVSYEDFLHCPIKDPNPHIVPLYPTEDWAVYNLLISKIVPRERLCIVKFEELRKNPIQETMRVLNFLGIDSDKHTIDAAIEKSSHTSVKKAAEYWYGLYPHLQQGSWKSLSRGKVGCWVETYSNKELSLFTGLPNVAIKEFGYPAKEVIADTHVTTNTEKHIDFGKEEVCHLWVRRLFGKDYNTPLAIKILMSLSEMAPYMVNRPLVIIAAARGLLYAKNPNGARILSDYVSTIPDLHYYEQIELAKYYLELKDHKSASRILVTASKNIPHPVEVSGTIRDLIKNKYYLSALIFFLGAVNAN